jgi:hypothetical protein
MHCLHVLLRDQAWEEVQVPSRSTHIDRLLDLRGQSLEGGLFHLLRRWCEGRLVALEHESGDPDARKVRLQMGKLWMAAAGRGQGDVSWPLVDLTQPITLLIVSPRARPDWFDRWGLPMQLIFDGLWVNEGPQMDVVVVRPNHLSRVPGGTSWGALHPHISATQALDLIDRLLGDPHAATIHIERVRDLLAELHPRSATMNQVRPQVPRTRNEAIDASFWHMTLRLHEACEAAERERDAVKQELDLSRQSERASLVRLLVYQGTSADELQDRTLEELRQMVADND